MEFRQLRYFLRIAELGSFSRASQALHIAQPALSQQIAQLEAELGHTLFHRLHRGVEMTEQGQAFYRQARRILKDIDDLPNVVHCSAEQLSGTVAVGLPQSTAVQYAMPLLREAARRFPAVGVELFDEISGHLLRELGSGRLDIAVVVSDQDAQLVDGMPLMDEELFLVSSGQQDHLTPFPVADLAGVPLTLPGMHHGVRAVVEEAVRAQGAQLPTPRIVANSINIMRHAVASGAACSVMPWAAVCEEIEAGTIRAIPLAPRLTRRVYVCTPRATRLSLAAQAVRDLLIETTRSRARRGEWLGVTLVE